MPVARGLSEVTWLSDEIASEGKVWSPAPGRLPDFLCLGSPAGRLCECRGSSRVLRGTEEENSLVSRPSLSFPVCCLRGTAYFAVGNRDGLLEEAPERSDEWFGFW